MEIGVVLVTYNRLSLLKKTLDYYSKLSKQVAYILVVNNNSTDGTNTFLEKWKNETSVYSKIVLNLHDNIGGSGGFAMGLKKAIQLSADWIWLADDDAFPDINCLTELEKYYTQLSKDEKDKIASLCSTVMNYEEIDLSHRKRCKKGVVRVKFEPVSKKEYFYNNFELDSFSFVGTLLKKDIVKEIGLPESKYFIYYDDSEYSIRVQQKGKIICVPSSIVYHNTGLDRIDVVPTWKTYYACRNQLLMYKKHYGIIQYLFRFLGRLKNCLKKPKEYRWIHIKILIKGFEDSLFNKKGLNSVYKPGWKYHEE